MLMYITIWLIFICYAIHGQLHSDCNSIQWFYKFPKSRNSLYAKARYRCGLRERCGYNMILNSITYASDNTGFLGFFAACCIGDSKMYNRALDNCQFLQECGKIQVTDLAMRCYKFQQFLQSYELVDLSSPCDTQTSIRTYFSCCTRDVGTWKIDLFETNYNENETKLRKFEMELTLCQFDEDDLHCQTALLSHYTPHAQTFTTIIQRMDFAHVTSENIFDLDILIMIFVQRATNLTILKYSESYKGEVIFLNNRTCREHEKNGVEYFGENKDSCLQCNCPYTCHPITGKCMCNFGYIGRNCEIEVCPYVTEEYKLTKYDWPTTRVGKTATVRCYIGYLMRLCKGIGEWDRVVVSKGCDCKIDVKLTSYQLNKITSKLKYSIKKSLVDEERANLWLSEASSTMNFDENVLHNPHFNYTQNILTLVEYFSVNVQIPDDKDNISLVSENINLVVKYVNSTDNDVHIDTHFRDTNCSKCTIPGPSLIIDTGLIDTDYFRLSIIVYRSAKLFPDTTITSNKSIYHVLSVTVNGITNQPVMNQPVMNRPVTNRPVMNQLVTNPQASNQHAMNGTFPIQTDAILTYIIPQGTNDIQNVTCVYWDKGNHTWITNDINTTVDENNRTVCLSPHLSIFSMLLVLQNDEKIPERHKEILTYITKIGCGISLVGLGITIIIYSLFPILRSRGTGQILLCLCISMFLLNFVFLIGSDKGNESSDSTGDNSVDNTVDKGDDDKSRDWQCLAAGITIHYFLLTTLLWMLLESLIMYQKLVVVFQSTWSHYLLKCSIVGWGLPALIVAITASVSVDVYQAEREYCILTLNLSNPVACIAFYCAVLTPACLVLIINTYVFIRVVIIILRKAKRHDDTTNQQGLFSYVSLRQVQGSLSVMIVLGVTWLFGPMSLMGSNHVFVYLFTVFNSIQGFLICIFQCLFHKEVQRAVIHFCRTGRRKQVKGSVNLVKRTKKTTKSTSDTSL